MNPIQDYTTDGWHALNGALIFCPSQVRLPLSPNRLVCASRARWGDRCDVNRWDDGHVSIGIRPPDEYSLVISYYSDLKLIGMDGLPEQNVRLAAWLRSLMPEHAPRIVVGNKSFTVHAELPFGVTPEQIASSMINHSVPGWNADDPDLQWA